MAVYRGVVKGKMVVFEEPVDLADGTDVEVRVVESGVTAAREEEFKLRLVESGLLDRIRRPEADPPNMERTLIPILGGPLVSQTLIEDRR